MSKPVALLMDDSPLLCLQLQQLLQELGYQAETFGGTTDLPEAAVVFIELFQAQGNGFQVLRKLAAACHCPLVLISGSGRDSDRYWGLQAGASAVIGRPVNRQGLQSALTACFPGGQ